MPLTGRRHSSPSNSWYFGSIPACVGIARPLLSVAFIGQGVDALRNPKPAAEAARPAIDGMRKLPDPVGPNVPTDAETFARVNAAVQVGGGLLLATGKMPRLASAALAFTVIPGSLGGHMFWNQADPERKADERRAFMTDLSLLGGLIIAAVDTEGKPSLGWRGRRAARKVSEAVTAALAGRGRFGRSARPTVRSPRRLAHGLQVGARARTRSSPHVARERAPEIAEAARERAAELAEVARERGPESPRPPANAPPNWPMSHANAGRGRHANAPRWHASGPATWPTRRAHRPSSNAAAGADPPLQRLRTVDCRYPPSRSGATMTTDPTPGPVRQHPQTTAPTVRQRSESLSTAISGEAPIRAGCSPGFSPG